jgi:hypothetical protein
MTPRAQTRGLDCARPDTLLTLDIEPANLNAILITLGNFY